MAAKLEKRWESWPVDPKTQYCVSDGGVQIRVLEKDGDGYTESSWAKLAGRDVDWMIRQLVREVESGFL